MASKKYGLAAKSENMGQMRTDVGDPAGLSAWTATTAISLGAYRRKVASNGWAYKCITAGTTGASEPTWPTTVDATVTDGTVVWQAYSKGVRCTLHTATYVPDQDAHRFISDLTNETTGTNYTAGGVYCSAAAGMTTQTYTGAGNTFDLDFNDPAWANITASFRYVVFAVDLGVAALSPLICYDDIGAQSPAGVTFTYNVNATGITRRTTA